MQDQDIEFAGEKLLLMAERVIYWPERSALLAADVHVGKDTTFRLSGIPVPESVVDADLERLSRAIVRTDASVLILLGDFQHARLGMTGHTVKKIQRWREQYPELRVKLLEGNHEKSSGEIPECWNFERCGDCIQEGPIVLRHHPPAAKRRMKPTICGHLHPAVRLFGKGGQSERLPCFYMERNLLVLPAFGRFTGSSTIDASKAVAVYAVTEEAVIKFQEQGTGAGS